MSKNIMINFISGNLTYPRSFHSFTDDLDVETTRYICLDLDGTLFQMFVCSDYYIVTLEEVYENRVPDISKIYINISSLSADEKKQFPKIVSNLSFTTRFNPRNLTLNELIISPLWNKAVIVFEPFEFDQESSIQERSFRVERATKFFSKGAYGVGLFGGNLSNSEQTSERLDLKLYSSDSTSRWKIDYCYIVD